MSLEIEAVGIERLGEVLPALAALRIEIFRKFPYLYDGDLAYEQRYLERFSKARDAVVVVARDGTEIVGASTAAPLVEVEPEFAEPFRRRGDAVEDIFYCAESVLKSRYRGRGIGHAFFDLREDRARRAGAKSICFCSVIRPENHPMRPEGYRPLDGFWRKRGYAPLDGVEAGFSWKDVGESGETIKRLQFWGRDLK